MTIPQKTRDLRKAFDNAQLFTLHIPGSKGYSHQLRVLTHYRGVDIMVMIETSRYTVFNGAYDEIRLTEISDVVEKVRELLSTEQVSKRTESECDCDSPDHSQWCSFR